MTIGVILLVLLGGSGRSIPASPAANPAISGPSGLALIQVTRPGIAATIEAYLINGLDPELGAPTRPEQVELKELYGKDQYLPLWLDAAGRPDHSAHDALTLLRGAAEEGLDPADYGQDYLDRMVAMLERESPLLRDGARFELALSVGMLRYFHHVHRGRVDPRTISLRLSVPADRHDFVALLRSAVNGDRLTEAVANLRPALEQYGALRAMLTRYRSLAADPTLDAPPPFAAVVRPGEPSARLDVLYRRLVALGDLSPGAPAPAASTAYEGALVDGVKRFQVRHGLENDGIPGRKTQAALGVPLAWRVRQIELALERLRWLPDLDDGRLVAINIPMFQLWAWDAVPTSEMPSLAMDVIVGRALRTQTPVFIEQMREVIFRPYWNVPPSIAHNEIFPILERDPDYLRRQNMEIVRGPGDDAQVVAATAENIARLRHGALRLRQRPGPGNALGLVKFVFPNEENVYMHGTPVQELFSRSRRDFSHGCVRVEDPVALAEWVLNDQPEWTREGILATMNGTVSLPVTLARPIQVILFYTTAAVMPEDGTIHFAEDIYLHDARLERALAHAYAPE